jgi:hypothetical protein
MQAQAMKVTAAFLGLLLLLQSCDEEENGEVEVGSGSAQPSKLDLLQGETIANSAGANAVAPGSSGGVTAQGNGDLSVLGGNANQNQQAFRQRFGLSDPTSDQLANWQPYDARLTAYSDKDADWPFLLRLDALRLV